MGVRLEQVPEQQRHFGERTAASGSLLHHKDLAAQQVEAEIQTQSEHSDLIQTYYYSPRAYLSLSYSVPLLSCRYLEYTLDPEKIRLMDVAFTISSVAGNVAGHALAWNFIRANWKYVKEG